MRGEGGGIEARKRNILVPDAIVSTSRYVDKDIISARFEEKTRQNERHETPKTQPLFLKQVFFLHGSVLKADTSLSIE